MKFDCLHKSIVNSIIQKRVVQLATLMLAALMFATFFTPSVAYADKSHECTRDVIQATVQTDGSLQVIDARTYEFEGRYTLTAAVLDPPENGNVIVNGVYTIDENGAQTRLTQVQFQPMWRNSGGPASGNYAIDTASNTVYAFSTTSDASKTFVFDYTYTNAIDKYNDASVLYWQFVGSNWDVDTQNVQAYLTLPVPAGQAVEPGENVYAFGHGNINGSISFNDDGAIEFDARRVREGQFAEMRVAFPASWTPDVASSQVVDEDVMPQILAEEKEWQQQTEFLRLLDVLLLIIPLLISLICIMVAVVLFFRYGKEHKPTFDGDYWRDVPEKGMNPAVVARIWRWNKSDANDLAAVLMHLSNLSVVRISSEKTVQERKILPDKENVVYHLSLNPEKLSALDLDAIDTSAIDLVFDKIGANGSVTFDEIEAYAQGHAKSYVGAMNLWQGKISSVVNRRGFFERTGERCKNSFIVAGGVLLALGILCIFAFENLMPFLGLLPGAIALFVFSRFMPRRSQEAVDIQARCEGLKRWFKDFTALDEAVPTDAKVWGELLVYAYIFGVADQVVKNLNQVAPDIWEADVFTYSMLWYYNPYIAMHTGAALSNAFGNVFENTMSSAQNIIAQANASSGSGGSFGGGGGFSVGGGGGFGGMGGGFSR